MDGGAERPKTIWFGNPLFSWWGIAPWTEFEVDYVKVMVPQMYLDKIEIRPELPGEPGDSHTIRIELEKLKPNEEIELEALGVENAGGHEELKHVDAQGKIIPRPNGGFALAKNATSLENPIDVHVGADGKATLYYRAPEIGGEVLISAVSLTDEHEVGEADIEVQVAGLVLLPDADTYVKIGGNCKHHGPSVDATVPQDCREPDNNHWGTPKTNEKLRNAATAVAGLNINYELKVNDMSLPMGGMFDVNGKWKVGKINGVSYGGHAGHRLGTNIDIRSKDMPCCGATTNNLSGNAQRIYQALNPYFHIYIHTNTDPPEHWHLTTR